MDVSVIIVNYNTLALTMQCVDSIYQMTNGVKFEIIIVDNASTDGSKEIFKKDSRVIFIEAEKNLGFGKANNLGVQKSSGNYLFFLNSDTILLNNAILHFFEFCESFKSKIGGVGCLLENDKGIYIHSYANFPSIQSVLQGFLFLFYLRFLVRLKKMKLKIIKI